MSAARLRSQRCLRWSACLRAGLIFFVAQGLAGCTSLSDGLAIFAPYRRPAQPEEYRSPPAQDARFTEPPTYPSHLLKPIYKVKDDGPDSQRKAFGAGAGPGSGPGAMGPMSAPTGY